MGTKFEGVDILDFLGQVVELHTQHYKEDFDVDKELIQKVALSGEPEERRLLWMSRPCGTYQRFWFDQRCIYRKAMKIKCGCSTMSRRMTRF